MPIPRQKLLEFLQRDARRPMLLRDIMRTLGVSKEKRREFRGLLEKMAQAGEIARIKGNRYGLSSNLNLVTGRLQGHPDGFGFVIPEKPGETDVFVARRNMGEAMHGDRVVARVESTRPARETGRGVRREGRILRVLERAAARIVGRFEWGRNREFAFVVPTDRRNWYDLHIPSDLSGEARDGDLVEAEILQYPTVHRNPEGRVREVLGRAFDPKTDTRMVMAEFSLPAEFSKECLDQAGAVPDHIARSMQRGLRDMRRLKTVTIDGEQARDFDDAVSIEPSEGGKFRLWVHIADVSSYVPWDSPLDLEARSRGTSVYFPDHVVPMFPERISNGICSLNPAEDRLTVTVEMLFDRAGHPLEHEIYPSIIKSDERMTYTDVAKILVDRDPGLSDRYRPLVPDFEWMRELAERLRARREAEGSIDFDLPEPQITLDLQGRTLDIIREERNVAHKIIEEFMLAANRTVGRHMTQKGIPCIYRIHDSPDPDRLKALSEFVSSFGLVLRIPKPHAPSGTRIQSKVIQDLLGQVKGKPEERLINHVVLRSMKQARYSVENTGHFGLAAKTYLHFTSPIRRYPDLIVHRLVKESLTVARLSPDRLNALQSLLPEIAASSSARERVAMEAEREVVDLKKVRFMNDKVGEEFAGFITGVTAFGFFVEMEEFLVEGLVHITSIPDDYYVYLENQHSLLGRRHRRRFRIADRVKVRVERVDLEKRKVDLTLAEETKPKPHLRKQPHSRRRPNRTNR